VARVLLYVFCSILPVFELSFSQVTINLVSTKRDQSSVFRVQDINVKVGTLKFAIRDSKHDFLYKTLRPLATALIKRQLQKVIKDTLRTGLEYIDGQLVAVRDRMAECKGEGRRKSYGCAQGCMSISFLLSYMPSVDLCFSFVAPPPQERRSFHQIRREPLAFQGRH
jgi:hypothetical protein